MFNADSALPNSFSSCRHEVQLMRQIKLTPSRRNAPSRRNEHGAVATIIVILFAGGIVLSTLALSADVGKVGLWERRQLQNGADAASRALTLTCAKNPAACNSSRRSTH